MNEQELYDDLCAKLDPHLESAELYGADEKSLGVSPVILAILKGWAMEQIRNLTCTQKDKVVATLTKWISEKVKNPFLATLLIEVSVAMIEASCASLA